MHCATQSDEKILTHMISTPRVDEKTFGVSDDNSYTLIACYHVKKIHIIMFLLSTISRSTISQEAKYFIR